MVFKYLLKLFRIPCKDKWILYRTRYKTQTLDKTIKHFLSILWMENKEQIRSILVKLSCNLRGFSNEVSILNYHQLESFRKMQIIMLEERILKINWIFKHHFLKYLMEDMILKKVDAIYWKLELAEEWKVLVQTMLLMPQKNRHIDWTLIVWIERTNMMIDLANNQLGHQIYRITRDNQIIWKTPNLENCTYYPKTMMLHLDLKLALALLMV